MLNVIYYLFFVRDIVLDFIINLLIVLLIQSLLYGFHSFAGGDFKLGMLLAFLYPARMYFAYRGMITTLFFALGCSFIYGYGYLLFSTLNRIRKGSIHPDKKYYLLFLKNYLQNYVRATAYIIASSMLLWICGQYIQIPTFVMWVLNMLIAWLSSRVTWMRKRVVFIIVVVIDIILSIALHTIPFSINPENYLFVAVLLVCQMIINTGIYELVDTDKVEKGMILSTAVSVMMQGSRVKGLPGISGEDLKDRLTESQAASVRRWGNTKAGEKKITIVRKIPFAIFLLCGFITYFIIWGILNAF